MSWSFGLTVHGDAVAHARSALDAAADNFANDQQTYGNTITEETSDQITAAMKAAEILLAAEGSSNAPEINIVLSGHSNPGHKPAAGTSHEFIQVNINHVY